jgi:glutathione S-transferase
MRCIWMLHEIRAPFELVPIVDLRASSYLALNPNGKMPTLVDGDVVLWESLAINLYLAQTRTTELSPRGRRELADVLKWTLWAQSQLEEFFNQAASIDAVGTGWKERTIGVLETMLDGRAHLIDERFTVADLNVCCMFLGPVSSLVTFEEFPAVQRWMPGCRTRAAYVRTVRDAQEAFRRRP